MRHSWATSEIVNKLRRVDVELAKGATIVQMCKQIVAYPGYDCNAHRMTLSCQNIPTRITHRTAADLAKIADRSSARISWLHQFKWLRIRYDRRADIHEAFVSLACSMICWRKLKQEYF